MKVEVPPVASALPAGGRPASSREGWSKEEDVLLSQLVKSGSMTWKQISACIPHRSTKQCKEHWRHVLDPNVDRSPWTAKEDQFLLEGQRVHGNSWSKIALLLPGRTQLQIRDRWRHLLGVRRKRNKEAQEGQSQPVSQANRPKLPVKRPQTKLTQVKPVASSAAASAASGLAALSWLSSHVATLPSNSSLLTVATATLNQAKNKRPCAEGPQQASKKLKTGTGHEVERNVPASTRLSLDISTCPPSGTSTTSAEGSRKVPNFPSFNMLIGSSDALGRASPPSPPRNGASSLGSYISALNRSRYPMDKPFMPSRSDEVAAAGSMAALLKGSAMMQAASQAQTPQKPAPVSLTRTL